MGRLPFTPLPRNLGNARERVLPHAGKCALLQYAYPEAKDTQKPSQPGSGTQGKPAK